MSKLAASWIFAAWLTFGSTAFPKELLKKEKAAAPAVYAPQHGDILFQSLPHNEIVDAIEGSTGSPFSHCGIVVARHDGWHVLEAIGPVKETPLRHWIAQGRGSKFDARRLKPEFRSKSIPMIAAARAFTGLPYDIQYEMDDAKIYCSELIYKAFKKAGGGEMGVIRTLGELNWRPYGPVIRAITGGEVPLQRQMITPKDLAEASQLELILPLSQYSLR